MLFLRLHPSTAFQSLLLNMMATLFLMLPISHQFGMGDGPSCLHCTPTGLLSHHHFSQHGQKKTQAPRGAVPCLSCAFSLSWVALNTSYTGDKMEHIWSFYIFMLFTVSNMFFILCSQCCYILFSLFQNSSLLASMGVFRDISHSEPKHILCLFPIGNWLLI